MGQPVRIPEDRCLLSEVLGFLVMSGFLAGSGKCYQGFGAVAGGGFSQQAVRSFCVSHDLPDHGELVQGLDIAAVGGPYVEVVGPLEAMAFQRGFG
ncbi:hypothetical protein ABZY44_23310 [Streptomyces sp. NPDC006544]|uniref:hypothetical protein n=1 Tax=Streptomyces sp. NPDC006544 TaxID=3154583 RepID=UPI0033ADF3E1